MTEKSAPPGGFDVVYAASLLPKPADMTEKHAHILHLAELLGVDKRLIDAVRNPSEKTSSPAYLAKVLSQDLCRVSTGSSADIRAVVSQPLPSWAQFGDGLDALLRVPRYTEKPRSRRAMPQRVRATAARTAFESRKEGEAFVSHADYYDELYRFLDSKDWYGNTRFYSRPETENHCKKVFRHYRQYKERLAFNTFIDYVRANVSPASVMQYICATLLFCDLAGAPIESLLQTVGVLCAAVYASLLRKDIVSTQIETMSTAYAARKMNDYSPTDPVTGAGPYIYTFLRNTATNEYTKAFLADMINRSVLIPHYKTFIITGAVGVVSALTRVAMGDSRVILSAMRDMSFTTLLVSDRPSYAAFSLAANIYIEGSTLASQPGMGKIFSQVYRYYSNYGSNDAIPVMNSGEIARLVAASVTEGWLKSVPTGILWYFSGMSQSQAGLSAAAVVSGGGAVKDTVMKLLKSKGFYAMVVGILGTFISLPSLVTRAQDSDIDLGRQLGLRVVANTLITFSSNLAVYGTELAPSLVIGAATSACVSVLGLFLSGESGARLDLGLDKFNTTDFQLCEDGSTMFGLCAVPGFIENMTLSSDVAAAVESIKNNGTIATPGTIDDATLPVAGATGNETSVDPVAPENNTVSEDKEQHTISQSEISEAREVLAARRTLSVRKDFEERRNATSFNGETKRLCRGFTDSMYIPSDLDVLTYPEMRDPDLDNNGAILTDYETHNARSRDIRSQIDKAETGAIGEDAMSVYVSMNTYKTIGLDSMRICDAAVLKTSMSDLIDGSLSKSMTSKVESASEEEIKRRKLVFTTEMHGKPTEAGASPGSEYMRDVHAASLSFRYSPTVSIKLCSSAPEFARGKRYVWCKATVTLDKRPDRFKIDNLTRWVAYGREAEAESLTRYFVVTDELNDGVTSDSFSVPYRVFNYKKLHSRVLNYTPSETEIDRHATAETTYGIAYFIILFRYIQKTLQNLPGWGLSLAGMVPAQMLYNVHVQGPAPLSSAQSEDGGTNLSHGILTYPSIEYGGENGDEPNLIRDDAKRTVVKVTSRTDEVGVRVQEGMGFLYEAPRLADGTAHRSGRDLSENAAEAACNKHFPFIYQTYGMWVAQFGRGWYCLLAMPDSWSTVHGAAPKALTTFSVGSYVQIVVADGNYYWYRILKSIVPKAGSIPEMYPERYYVCERVCGVTDTEATEPTELSRPLTQIPDGVVASHFWYVRPVMDGRVQVGGRIKGVYSPGDVIYRDFVSLARWTIEADWSQATSFCLRLCDYLRDFDRQQMGVELRNLLVSNDMKFNLARPPTSSRDSYLPREEFDYGNAEEKRNILVACARCGIDAEVFSLHDLIMCSIECLAAARDEHDRKVLKYLSVQAKFPLDANPIVVSL